MTEYKKTVFFIRSEQIRQNLIREIMSLPLDDEKPITVHITDFKRSDEQSARFHATCGDAAKQLTYNGQHLKLWQWKNLFVSGFCVAELKEQAEDWETGFLVQGLEGELVNIRESTAQMGVKRTAKLITYTNVYCDENGAVRFERDYNQWGY